MKRTLMKITLSQAITMSLEAKQAQRLSGNTLIDYKRTYRKFQAFFVYDPRVINITVQDICKFLNSLDGVSKKTVLNCHIGLSSLWTWLKEEEICPENIVRKVKRPKPEIRAIDPFTREEVVALLDALERPLHTRVQGKKSCSHRLPNILRNRAIILLLLDTGIRATELCTLQFKDLNLNRVKVFGKGSKERILPISARTRQVIREYLENERRDPVTQDDYLFVTRWNKPLSNDELYHLVAHAGARAGISRAHPHKFRHTFAINFLRNGGNIYALQMMLGHSSLEMVKRYLAIAQADLEEIHKKASPVTSWQL